MHRNHAAVLLSLAMITLAVPAVAAGGTTSRSDSVNVLSPTPTLSSAHRYQIDLTADTSVDATLSWEDDRTDLDLLLTPPGGTCALLPPAVDCLVESTESRVEGAACQQARPGYSLGLGPGTESISTTADGHDSGEATYGLWVLVSTGVPLTAVDYDLTVTTGDDGHEDLNTGPDVFLFLRNAGHCRGV